MISAFHCVFRFALLACAVAVGSSLMAQETAPAALPYRGEQPVRAQHAAVEAAQLLVALVPAVPVVAAAAAALKPT